MLEYVLDTNLFTLYLYSIVISNITNVLFRDGINKRYDELEKELKEMKKVANRETHNELCFVVTFIPVVNLVFAFKTMFYSLKK